MEEQVLHGFDAFAEQTHFCAPLLCSVRASRASADFKLKPETSVRFRRSTLEENKSKQSVLRAITGCRSVIAVAVAGLLLPGWLDYRVVGG
jgi:hypothetical protein